MKDVLVVIQDTGMRPQEVFRIRIENINWSQRLIFSIPMEKPKQHVGMYRSANEC